MMPWFLWDANKNINGDNGDILETAESYAASSACSCGGWMDDASFG
jgi:hypothetical protein